MTATDHPCVLSGGRFAPGLVNRLPVDGDGRLDLEALDAALAGAGAPLVATHLANNETGVIQDVEVIAARVHAAGGVLVVDAAQAPGRLALDLPSLGADAFFLSSHKIGGPMGAGAIVLAGDLVAPAPLIAGGGQERGLRGGTENVMAIAGFGAAAELAVGADSGRLMALRRRFEAMIIARAPDAVIHAAAAPRLPNTVYFTLPGRRAETLQIAFDLAGVAVSAGSACSSGKVQPSHVVEAMGYGPELAQGAVRLSLGWSTTETDIDLAVQAWRKLADGLVRGRRNTA